MPVQKPEEDPTMGQISDKDVQCYLCLVVRNYLGDKLFLKNVYVIKVLAQ